MRVHSCEDEVVRLVFLLVAVGCYAPDPPPGARCAGGICPSGLVCSAATDTCERIDIDAARSIDAALRTPALVQHKGGQQVGVDSLPVTLDATP